MLLNHPQNTPPPQSVEKLSFMGPVPHAKKAGDHCPEPLPALAFLMLLFQICTNSTASPGSMPLNASLVHIC